MLHNNLILIQTSQNLNVIEVYEYTKFNQSQRDSSLWSMNIMQLDEICDCSLLNCCFCFRRKKKFLFFIHLLTTMEKVLWCRSATLIKCYVYIRRVYTINSMDRTYVCLHCRKKDQTVYSLNELRAFFVEFRFFYFQVFAITQHVICLGVLSIQSATYEANSISHNHSAQM